MKSWTSLKMGHVGQKLCHWVKSEENLVYAVEATFSVRYSRNLVRRFALMKPRTSLKIADVRSKARSLDQMSERPCVRSKGHIFSPIIMKLGQNVCLDKSLDEFENGSCPVKS